MPKPGKFNNKQSWKTQYSEHDFRAGGGDTRRVSFKPQNKFAQRNGGKDWVQSVRSHLQDEDIDMGGSSGAGRTFNRKHFKGNKRWGNSDSAGPNRGGKRRLLDGPMSWFKVTLPYGNKYEKSFIMKTLNEKVQPLTFWPVSWETNGNLASFYVDEFKVAEKLNELDREFQMPDGFRLVILVRSGMPTVDVDGALKEKIKKTMAKRYTAATKALDLTKFHADPDLQDCFCALFKPVVLMAVIDIIAENIPELEAINLFENRLTNISYLKKVNEKLPNLKVLHMGNNRLRDMSMMDPLMGLPVVDLVLHGNPLCTKFKDQEVYIGEVRKRFPKVMKLDGVDLAPPIKFDLSEETAIPPARQTFLCAPEGEAIIREFLGQYFLIFDTDNRQPLLNAYHESALFSMTMCYPYGQKDKNLNWLNWYTTENRNLMRVNDPERRNKLLKQGQVAVVSFLQDMPQTKHDIHSFTVDLNLFTPQMISLTVTGIFKELKSGHKVPPTRYFMRTLIIVPAGAGFCIANETLHITNATEEQAKLAFKTPTVSAPSTPVNSSPVVVSTAVSPLVVPEPDEATKQQMIQAMCQQSGMNVEWSLKCLVETKWDFATAIRTFTDLQQKGIIPPQAFIK